MIWVRLKSDTKFWGNSLFRFINEDQIQITCLYCLFKDNLQNHFKVKLYNYTSKYLSILYNYPDRNLNLIHYRMRRIVLPKLARYLTNKRI